MNLNEQHPIGQTTPSILEIDEPVTLLQPVKANARPCGALVSDAAIVFDPKSTEIVRNCCVVDARGALSKMVGVPYEAQLLDNVAHCRKLHS